MSNSKTIRAWKDPEYRASLSAEELALLPENPAGLIELTDAALGEVAGGLIARPKPRTPLCPTAPKTSVEKGCTVTASYLPCVVAY
jgi:mersacidin/lichenicidin family type 2 lantibiotic